MSIDVYPAPGERLRRLRRRRRLVKEEMLAVVVLLLFLGATVAVLATQWLSSGSSGVAASASAHAMSATHGGST